MGLIKAAMGAIGGNLADQWLEYFYCDSMPSDVLVAKAQVKKSGRSSNTKGSDNVISNGSVIAVNEGQCMIIVDHGKVTEFSAEAGEFKYDSSSEPSLFSGKLGESILGTFKSIGKRFAFGGEPPKDQRVYFFNTKELMGNKYGTPTPVIFSVAIEGTNKFFPVKIRCNGEYSYRIADPILFYTNVCGNVSQEYRRDQIESMMKTELLSAMGPAFAAISKLKIPVDQLPAHNLELSDALNEALSAQWSKRRGVAMVSIGINTLTPDPADMEKLQKFAENVMYSDPGLAAGAMVSAQANAMQTAAGNQGGAMAGFMGLYMAAQAGGMNANQLFGMAAQQQAQQPQATAVSGGWTCSCGKSGNTGKFCDECGKPKPTNETGWTCACGAVNSGKFCTNCGKPKPAGALLYKCDKCGWTPPDPHNPPKFCPECGDVFDERDVVR
jgi:membrane protease subunit (stomatin/prohibitin family)